MRTSARSSSPSRSVVRRAGALVTASAVALGTLTAHAPLAFADGNVVNPNGKGIIGGALLGGEVVVIVESIAGAKPAWAYILGASLGAVAGGAGGYAVEQNSSDGKAPVYMLAGGLGLIIPALVLTLNATRYMPTESAVEDHPPSGGPAANPGTAGVSAVAPATATPPTQPPPPGTMAPAPATAPAVTPAPSNATPPPATGSAPPPLSLFDVNGGSMRMGVPIPEVRPTFTMAEVRQYGLAQQTEVRMPLVKVTF